MRRVLLATALLSAAPAIAGEAELRARYGEMRPSPDVASMEMRDSVRAEVYGVMPHALDALGKAFAKPADWCDMLLVTYNVVRCEVTPASTLSLLVVKSALEPIDKATPMEFEFRASADGSGYMRRTIEARRGPAGTRNYAVVIEAVALDTQRSFVHLGYSYEYGPLTHLAMQVYLATAGAGKVGFTVTGEHGNAELVTGERAGMERNTMRYFLAIDAYLDSLAAPPDRRLDARLNAWFDACERYHRQLWEMPRDEYLSTKRALLASDSNP